jgi:predicted lipoprotein with Yx(FWY)xxD motif
MVNLKRGSLLIMGLLLFALAACSVNPAYANTNGQTAQQSGKISQDNVQAHHSQSSGHKDGPAKSKSNGMHAASQQNTGKGDSHNHNSNAAIVIHTATVMINGKTVTILTTANGHTLYYRTSDPAPASTCTGSCAKAWPPLIAASGKLIYPNTLQGHVSVYKTANGYQVEFNGHPLYTYAGDMAAGQFNGQSLGGVWYVAAIIQQQQPQPRQTPPPQPTGTPQPPHW